MNTDLRKKAKNNFEKYFFVLMNNVIFWKKLWEVLENIAILSLSQQKEEETKYYKVFYRILLAMEMKNTEIHMNKPVHVGLSILELGKTLMYKFWYDYVKPKWDEKIELCYMNTDSFIVHIKKVIFIKTIDRQTITKRKE